MAKAIYFSDMNGQSTELAHIEPLDNKKFATMFPNVKGKRWDGFSMIVGCPVGHASVFIAGEGWNHGPLMPVTRIIIFKSSPSLHKCDARCMNAKGHNCECSCGGKNHGAGNFNCE